VRLHITFNEKLINYIVPKTKLQTPSTSHDSRSNKKNQKKKPQPTMITNQTKMFNLPHWRPLTLVSVSVSLYLYSHLPMGGGETTAKQINKCIINMRNNND